MSVELAGDLAVFLSFLMALIAGAAFFITASGRRNLFQLGVRAYVLQILFVIAACVYLFYLFFTHDFRINYVYQYSSTVLPFFYLLSSFWAGQEGTYLLWLLFSSLFGLVILYRGGRYTTWGLVFYSIINLFFAVILMNLSPFRLLPFPAAEGAGLNPLLQDPWMVIHPPVMFMAYAAAGVPFALALAAMVRRDFSDWLKISFPYVVLTSLLLIAANVMGGYWAYKTLGWGGYWSWDPVENTSFVPWVISIGLIHGMLIERRSGALRRSNLLLTCVMFFLVVYGTFLTRSGVLADFSVHSFVDLGINSFLVFFMMLFLVITLVVFFVSRSPEKIGRPLNYNIFSQDFILYAGMMLMLVLGAIVEFWSSLPMITRYFMANPSSPDVATYNAFAFPLAILVSLFLTLTPFVVGKGRESAGLKTRAVGFGLAGLVLAGVLLILDAVDMPLAVTLLIYVAVMLIYVSEGYLRTRLLTVLASGVVAVIVGLMMGVRSFGYLFFIGAAVAAAGAHVHIIIKYLRNRPGMVGGHLAHFGVGMMLVGIIVSSAFATGEKVVLPRNVEKSSYDIAITYHGMAGSVMTTNNELLVTLGEGDQVREARPHFFYVPRMEAMMKRPYIDKHLSYDLYLSPMDVQELAGGGGLHLVKGQTDTLGDYTVSFIDYDMQSHGSGGEISVAAELEVGHAGVVERIKPVLASGKGGVFVSEPIPLMSGSDYMVKLDQVLPGEGAVVLEIPGLIEVGPPDQLLLDVSFKPGINLLWLGTILISIGLALVTIERIRR